MDLPTHMVLKTGARIPIVGFGTTHADSPSVVEDALSVGYRHLDGAWKYGADKEIGTGIRNSGVPRADIFITSKFWPNFAREPELSLDLTLEATQTDYVDLFLMHWPVAFVPSGDLRQALAKPQDREKEGIKYLENGKPAIDQEYSENLLLAWRKMEALQRSGKAKALGVSNFSIKQLEKLLPHVSPDTPLCVNQVEAHPWFANTELIEYCKSKGIIVEAYSPMGGRLDETRRRVDDPVIKEIASQQKLTPGQLVQSWAVQRGTIPLGRSSNKERMRKNLEVKRLSEKEMESLNALDLGEAGRKGNPDWGWPIFD